MTDKVIEVSCAIIFDGDKILATRRSKSMKHPRKWEFPGGKLKPGENPVQAIHREIQEELGIRIETQVLLPMVEQHYMEFSVYMFPFICLSLGGEIDLAEHSTYKWLTLDELDKLDWLPADIKVIDFLSSYLAHRDKYMSGPSS